MRIIGVMERTETLKLEEWRARRIGYEYSVNELRRLVQDGIDSGPGLDGEAVFAGLAPNS